MTEKHLYSSHSTIILFVVFRTVFLLISISLFSEVVKPWLGSVVHCWEVRQGALPTQG